MTRVTCASTYPIEEPDGRSRRVRCERSTWLPRRYCEGPHRAEYAPPTPTGKDGALEGHVVSWE